MFSTTNHLVTTSKCWTQVLISKCLASAQLPLFVNLVASQCIQNEFLGGWGHLKFKCHLAQSSCFYIKMLDSNFDIKMLGICPTPIVCQPCCKPMHPKWVSGRLGPPKIQVPSSPSTLILKMCFQQQNILFLHQNAGLKFWYQNAWHLPNYHYLSTLVQANAPKMSFWQVGAT